MKHSKINRMAAVLSIAAVGFSGLAMPAFALAGAAVGSRLATHEAQLVSRAGTEIANRVDAMNALLARVNNMQRLSDSEKSSLSAQVQAQIAALTTLQSRVSADQASNNTTSLKDDVQSITKAYRIYALVLPQAQIAAAADRAMTIASAMTTLITALQTRIAQAQSAGTNMTAAASALANMQAKVADANTQAQSAVSATISLAPDNGSSTLMMANIATLKTARNDIQAAQKDLVSARQDAITIVNAVRGTEKAGVSATATATATTTATP